MRLLMDTQILLYSIYQQQKIPAALRSRLSDPDNHIVFSAVSIAEIAIKSSLGRSDFPYPPEEVVDAARATGFVELPLDARQSVRLAALPWHHRDPFDRLLIAQTLEEGLRFVTTDRLLTRYSDQVELIPCSIQRAP
jgi:PIN domain nuclease of toxin-antitoxin system